MDRGDLRLCDGYAEGRGLNKDAVTGTEVGGGEWIARRAIRADAGIVLLLLLLVVGISGGGGGNGARGGGIGDCPYVG